MENEKLDQEEIFLIIAEIDKKIIDKYGVKKLSKKQYILELLEYRGSVSLQLLSEIMCYRIDLLKNWVIKLSVEHRISIEGRYPDWILFKI